MFHSVPVGTRKVIALTFDDGPWPGNTESILSILAQYKVKATFFQIGSNLASSPDLGRAVRNAGHAIGNHTWSHQEAPADPADEVNHADTEIQTVYGGPTGIFRPPYGNFDNGVVQVSLNKNQAVIVWSVDTEDWNMPGVDSIVNTAVSGAAPGAIVLMHDGGGDRSQTIAALPKIITTLSAQGYTFLTVPELLALAYGQSNDPGLPVVTITTPTNTYSYGKVDAAGTATDASPGVASVGATLQRKTDNLYWNGTAWNATSATLGTTFSGSNWSLPMSFLTDGTYVLSVTAKDKANNLSNPASSQFRIDTVPPVLAITSPATSTTATTFTSATGTASDPNGGGIRSVSTALIRSADGYWWTGSTWVSAYTEVPATLSGSNWTFTFPSMKDGAYIFWAQSKDYLGLTSPWARADLTVKATTTTTTTAKTSALQAPTAATPTPTVSPSTHSS